MELTMLPQSLVYHLTAEGMHFTVTETLCASRVEKWIRTVKRQFLDIAPIKCVGLDCEFAWCGGDDVNHCPVGNPKRKV
jgi:hypothetical protein